jgi:hypothetical protein
MIALIKGLALALAVLSVVYLSVALWSASLRRERLEKEWDASGREGDRDAYVEAGMEAYRRSFRRRALILIYVVPLSVIVALVYLVNRD